MESSKPYSLNGWQNQESMKIVLLFFGIEAIQLMIGFQNVNMTFDQMVGGGLGKFITTKSLIYTQRKNIYIMDLQ